MAFHLDDETGKNYLLSFSGWFLGLRQASLEASLGKFTEFELRIVRLFKRYDKISNNVHGIGAARYRFPNHNFSKYFTTAENLLQRLKNKELISETEWESITQEMVRPLQDLIFIY